MTLHGLVTSHGTVLCHDGDGRPVHRSPPDVAPADLILVDDGLPPRFVRRLPGLGLVGIDPGARGPARATVPPEAHRERMGDRVAFRFPTGYLSLPPDGTVRMDGAAASDWEQVHLVDEEALGDLLELAAGRHVDRASGAIIEGSALRIEHGSAFRLGGRLYRIGGNLPFDRAAPRRLLFRDGWMVDELVSYRPLVYFVLMGGGSYREQLRLAAASLATHGAYDGALLVISDRDRALIEEAVGETFRSRFAVLPVASSDKVDAVLARLMLDLHPEALLHAPILYADTDVIFDRPLAPFLVEMLLNGRMSAQPEPWNRLPGSAAAGGPLFEEDPAPLDHPHGFNAGIWAMGGGARSVQVLSAIRLAVSRYLETHGRDALPWLDQAMANHVLRKLDCFDPGPVDRATRLCQAGHPLDMAGRRGFVHFWPVSNTAEGRAEAMRAYLARLDASSARTG